MSRARFEDALEFVAASIHAHGQSNSFEFMVRWLEANDISAAPVLTFLEARRLADDYSFVVSGGPFSLFGPTPDRQAWMPLARPELEALIEKVDESCEAHGCDHSTRFTRQWLIGSGYEPALPEMALLAQGAGCDCEVVLNVDPDVIYTGAETVDGAVEPAS